VPSVRRSSPARVGFVLLVLTALCGGVNASITHALAAARIDPVRINQFRFIVAFVIYATLIALLRPELLAVPRPARSRLCVAGLFVAFGTGLAYIVAISRLQVGTALALVYTSPLLLLGWASVSARRIPSSRAIAAVLLAVLGCWLVVQAADSTQIDALGVAAALFSAAAFATYVTLMRSLPVAVPALTIVFVVFAVAAVALSLWPPLWTFPVGALTAWRWLGLFGVMLFATLLPYALVAGATLRLPGPVVGVGMTLEPVFAVCIAWATLGEALAPGQILGIVMVLGGAAMAQVPGLVDPGRSTTSPTVGRPL
jgi:drug/metabolite transporter (DMT)-like permease